MIDGAPMPIQHHSIFSRLSAILSPAAKQEQTPEVYTAIFQALYHLMPDHEHPKTWANSLRYLQDDNERQLFSAYEWHSAKIIINHIHPPSKEIKNPDKPPPGKNNIAIVSDHFQDFVRKYNELGREKKIDHAAAKKLLLELRSKVKEYQKNLQPSPRMK